MSWGLDAEERRKHDEWLQNLKAGDEVAVASSGMGGRVYTFHKVAKITPTQVVVLINPQTNAVTRFRRDGGDEVGAEVWHRSSIEEATPELKARITAENRRKNIIYKLSKFNWRDLTDEELVRIYDVVREKKSLTE